MPTFCVNERIIRVHYLSEVIANEVSVMGDSDFKTNEKWNLLAS